MGGFVCHRQTSGALSGVKLSVCCLHAFVHKLYIIFLGLCHHRQKPETQGKYKVVSLSKVYVRVTCQLICIF